ncbi:hypothetical protein [Limnoglobus roseus]|nr:hypothetical protein [Limnoglobus roseus]
MSPEELQSRYVAEIEKRGVDDKYIDGVEERELMQIAIQHGFSTDRARTFLADVCRERGYVIEAVVVQQIREKLLAKARRNRAIRQSAFESVVREASNLVGCTTRTEGDVRKLVMTTMDDSGIARIKKWWGGDWYSRMKRDLGLA